MLHRARGDARRVVENYRMAVQIGQSFLPTDHREVKTLMHDLAAALGTTGESEEALVWWKKLLAVAADGSREAADVLLEVAHLERKGGQAAEALESYRRARATYARIGGPLAEGHVRASIGEAMALVALRSDDDAAHVLERLVHELRHGGPGCRRLFGEAASELGEFQSMRGRLAEARKVLEDARDALEREVGANHHLTCETVGRLAQVLERSGDHAGAEMLYRSVIEGIESWQRHREGWVAIYGNCVARLCQQRKEYAEAEVWLRRAIRNGEIAWGAQADALGEMRYRLGTVLEDQGARGAAWTTLLQALGTYQRNDSLEKREVLDILKRLVRMISADVEPPDVQSFVRELIASLEHAYAENHLNIAFLYRAMGESLVLQGQFRAALPWLDRSLAMTLRHFGSHTNEVANLCMFVEDARIAAAVGPLRPWTAGLPPAGGDMTWQLRLAYDDDQWEAVVNFAQHYLEDACETWLADRDDVDDWNDVSGPVAKFEATCGAHEHLIVVSTDGLVLGVMGHGTAAPDARLAELESRLLLALARNPQIVIDGWTLLAGAAGAQEVVAAGDAAALAARIAPS
jgi:tetratricopeptide (TPR) repeat protein